MVSTNHDNSESDDRNGIIGSIPNVSMEVEEVERLFSSNGPQNDLGTLSRSRIAAYKLYYKTRPSASKQSVRRARDLLAEVGGPQCMQSLTHPSYAHRCSSELVSETAEKVLTDSLDRMFVDTLKESLRSFR